MKATLKRKYKDLNDAIKKGWLMRPTLRKQWRPKKLNLGDCNSKFAAWGWETVDISDADYQANFRTDNLPLPNDAASIILSSHMIEHISDESVIRLFNEVYRVLKKGGTFRVVCPDMDLIRQAYEGNDLYFFLQNESTRKFLFDGIQKGDFPKETLEIHLHVVRTFASYIETGLGPFVTKEVFEEKYKSLDKYEFAQWCVSLMDTGKFNDQRDWGHINAYDYMKIQGLLKDAGFSQIKRSDYLTSDIAELRNPVFDKPSRRWISVYVEAVK